MNGNAQYQVLTPAIKGAQSLLKELEAANQKHILLADEYRRMVMQRSALIEVVRRAEAYFEIRNMTVGIDSEEERLWYDLQEAINKVESDA